MQSYRTYAVVRDIAEDDDDEDEDESLEVTFIDVGTGLSILVEGPADDDTMLIDAGEREDGDTLVSELQKEGVSTIDRAVFTHNHSDHIGGAEIVLNETNVQDVYYTGLLNNDTSDQENFTRAMRVNDMDGAELKRGDGERLTPAGDSYDVDVLNPLPGETDDIDNPSNPQIDRRSIILRIEYEETTFFLASDVRQGREGRLINNEGVDPDSEILQASHHGSATANSQTLLEEADPSLVAISSEEPEDSTDNPDSETLGRINNYTTANVTWTGDGIHHGTISISVTGEAPNDFEVETENTASTEAEDIKEKIEAMKS